MHDFNQLPIATLRGIVTPTNSSTTPAWCDAAGTPRSQ